jgi:hypothetical protein
MKTMTAVLWGSFVLLGSLLLLNGCGGGDDTTTPPTQRSDSEVLADGWSALAGGDATEAEEEFRRLIGREALMPQAFTGLGWTFTRTASADSALANFRRAAATGVDTTLAGQDARAGQCFAENALGHHAEAVTAGETVNAPWSLTLQDTYDFADVALTLASSHYMLGNFEESLAAVNQIVNFMTDVSTVEGRAALAALIEELLNS